MIFVYKKWEAFCRALADSSEKDIPYEDLTALVPKITAGGNHILSTHPHRWTRSALKYRCKAAAFRVIRGTAKLLIKIPFMKRWMSKYYYLAKKI